MAEDASAQIDAYIAGLTAWQRAIVVRLRELIHETAPELHEEWKWGTPIFSAKSPVVALGTFKDHVKINFFKGALLADQRPFNAGLEAKTSRAIDIREGEPVDEATLVSVIRSAAVL